MTPSELNVDQTVQLISDQFEITFNGADVFENRASFGFADISTGLLDADLNPVLVRAISGGVIDEVELRVAPDTITSVVRGRNAAAYAVDSTVSVTYSVNSIQPPEPTQVVSVPGFPTMPTIPGVTVPRVLNVGPTLSASFICRDLASRVGLACVYDAPDYFLREDFVVTGSVASAIQQLVEPFSHFEPSKVDIWCEGTTLVIRSRGHGGPGISISAHDTRITTLVVRSRSLGYIRVIRMTGSVTGGDHRFFSVDPGDEVIEDTDDTEKDGVVASRVVTRETRRILDKAVKHQVIETFQVTDDDPALHIVSRATTTSEWDDLALVYPNQIANSPKERRRTVYTDGIDPDTGTFGPSQRTTISHAYDSDGFLRTQTTFTETWSTEQTGFTVVLGESEPVFASGWLHSTGQTKQYRRNGAETYQVTSQQFNADGTLGPLNRATARGTPPGGPGRAPSAAAAAQTMTPVTYAEVVGSQPGAKDFSLTNNNLLPSHFQLIAAQAKAASGASEVEVHFTAAGIPWIHRGQYVTLTGVTDEDGDAVALQPALVTEVKTEYKEGSPNPTYLSSVKMTWWETI